MGRYSGGTGYPDVNLILLYILLIIKFFSKAFSGEIDEVIQRSMKVQEKGLAPEFLDQVLKKDCLMKLSKGVWKLKKSISIVVFYH